MSYSSDAVRSEQAFTALYQATYGDVVRFVGRRAQLTAVEDVAAEVFLVVWRRFDEAPADAGDARAWIFGIARNCLLNAHRGQRRHQALGVRLSETAPGSDDGHSEAAVLRIDLASVWPLLSPVHQEALSLAVLDDLNAREAAEVLGISTVAYRLRLSRARRVLRSHLGLVSRTASPRVAISEGAPS